jgi:hypothetical protein
MIKIINRLTLVLILSFCFSGLAYSEAELRDNPPSKYYVKEGDTLWDISSLFLKNPWAWPEIWHINNQVSNPHLIYPGDEISLVYIEEQPKIMVTKREPGVTKKTVKLSPEKRSYQISSTIPTIPLEKVESFLTAARVVDKSVLKNASYVIAADERRTVMGGGDTMYALGDWSAPQNAYGVYRPGKPFVDPVTKEVLGYEARELGLAKYITDDGDVATFKILRADLEIREYDKLLPTETQRVEANFYPKSPNTDIKGEIIRVFSGVKNIGQYDVVVINRGEREGVELGDVFAIFRTGEIVRDKMAHNQKIQLPDEKSGLLMVFKTYDKVSLGLVLQAKSILSVGNKIERP